MRRFIFSRDHKKPYHDCRVIEAYANYSEVEHPIGYFLFSITKLIDK
jgi:hypothetical protein